MWVSRAVVLASVLMMLISDSNSKPQNQNVQDVSPIDEVFLNQLTGEGRDQQVCPSPSATCIPFGKCCDPPVTESPAIGGPLVTESSGAHIISHIINPKLTSEPCGGLNLCCENPCDTPELDERCGIRNTDTDRVAGVIKDTKFGEFPWMVAVLTQGDDGYIGGGSLLHRKVVLTAAHKLDGKSNFIARLGEWDISEKNAQEDVEHQNIKVKKVVIHPEFSRRSLINNVALLILESDAVLGRTVMPICLPEPNQNFDGSQCIVTGWGKTALDTNSFQAELKKVVVPAVNHNDCQSMLRNTVLGQTYVLHDTFNCAGGKGEDSCEGDGGSPLICPKPNKPNEYVQMGVTAWGIGCGIEGNPGVYGSVPKRVDWIKKIISEEGGAMKKPERG